MASCSGSYLTCADSRQHATSTRNHPPHHRPSFSKRTDIPAHFIPRTYLFSHIYLCVFFPWAYRRRAAKFIRILKYKKNSDLISHIRSLKIVVYLPSQTYSQQRRSPKRLLELVGIETNPTKTGFTVLKNAPIEEVILRGSSECDFRNHRTSTLLLEMCSNPSIKTLRIEGLHNVPYRFIIGNGQSRSLARLVLWRATISDYWFDTPAPTIVSTAEGIETLELVGMTSKELLKPLSCFSSLPLSPISECFKNIVITLPQWSFGERKEVWNIILGVAGTLKSLELRLSTTPPDACEVSLRF